MHFSTYVQNIIAEYVRGTDFPAAPASLTIALSAGDPTADGSGLAEPSTGDGYARQTLSLGAPVATTGSGVSCFNDTTVTFGPVTTSTWPTVSHVAIFDDSNNLIMFGPLNVQRTSPVGDEIPLDVTSVQLQVSTYFGHYFGNILLNWARGITAPAAPVGTYMALSMVDPLDDGSAMDEPILGYSRKLITFSAPGATANGTPIVSDGPYLFGPADVDWGVITYCAVVSSSGDLFLKGPVAMQRDVVAGDSFAVPLGALTILFT